MSHCVLVRTRFSVDAQNVEQRVQLNAEKKSNVFAITNARKNI